MAKSQRKSGGYTVTVYDPRVGRAVPVGRILPEGGSTFPTLQLARRAETKAKGLVEEAIKQGYTSGSSMSVGDFLDRWLEWGLAKPWAPQTLRVNRDAAERLKKSRWGVKALNRVTRADMDDFAKTVGSHTVTRLCPAFSWAKERGWLNGESPIRHLYKRGGARQLEGGWLKLEDVQELADIASRNGMAGQMLGHAITIAAWTCIRPNELVCLRLGRDIDLDYVDEELAEEIGEEWARGSLRVGWSWDGKAEVNRTKSTKVGDRSRELILPPAAAEAAVASAQIAKEVFGASHDRVICNSLNGTLLRPGGLTGRGWDKVRSAAGRPDMQFYELRHFGASRLLDIGVSEEDVARQLGHTDVQLLRRHYGHPDQRRTRRRIRRALHADHLARSAKVAETPGAQVG